MVIWTKLTINSILMVLLLKNAGVSTLTALAL
jgi:hypothetical protein